MKKTIALTLLFSLLACSSASALGISVDPAGASPDGIYSLWLDGMNEEIDSIDFSYVVDGAELLNPDSGLNGFVPRGPGEPFTFVNALLAAPSAAPGGQGWSLVGNEATTAGIRIAGGPLGAKIDTSAPLFLANVMLPVGAIGTVRASFVNGGNTVGMNAFPFPFPEPSCLVLLSLGLISLAGIRR